MHAHTHTHTILFQVDTLVHNIFLHGILRNTPVLTPWYLIVHDVIDVCKSWRGAQGQGLASD